MYECEVCKKYIIQGGRCNGGTRNCLYFEEEPRGRMIRETINIYFDNHTDILLKYDEKIDLEDGRELTVVKINYVDFSKKFFCIDAYYHESEKTPEIRRNEFRVINGGEEK